MLTQSGLVERRIAATALARVLGPRGEGAAYVALADGIRRAILDGSLPLSTRLPSERELAEALTVSRTTTAAAYDRLRSQGFLSTRRGSGSVSTIPAGPRPATGSLFVSDDDDAGSGVASGSTIDLVKAAPSAPAQLHDAALRALEVLPRYLGTTGYTYLGIRALREVLAERYTVRGTPTSPDEILVTSGAQQAISLLMNATVGRGERVVVEHPTYPNAIGAVRAAGGRAVPVPVGPDGLDLNLLESTIRQSAPRVVHLTPDHHNPTGTSLDAAARERVRYLATRHRVLVVGDETLTDLTIDGERPPSFTGPRTRREVATIGSASKSFWGGMRVGWIRAHPELVTRLAAARAADDISTAILDQLIVTELLAGEARLVEERRRRLREQRDAMLAAVERLLPWRVAVPAGGLSAWAELGAPVSTALSALALQHGVRVVPGPLFGVDGSFEDRLRLPYTQPPEVLIEGVARIARAWQALDLAPADDRRRHATPGPVV